MAVGFLNTQHTLVNLQGSTSELKNINSGSTIVGISLSGSGYTFQNDIPTTWTGSFNDFSYIQLNENEEVVWSIANNSNTLKFANVYTLETPSGSLSVTDQEYILVAQKNRQVVWDEETETTSSIQSGWNIYFEQLDGIEWGSDEYSNHYLVKLKSDNSTFEYVPVTGGFQEVNTENPSLLGQFPVSKLDIEESDLFLVNRFIVHNDKGFGEEECEYAYEFSRCSDDAYFEFAFQDEFNSTVIKIGTTCYENQGSVSPMVLNYV